MGTVRGGGRGEAGGVDATVETIDDDAESLDDDEYSESATVPTEWRAGCNWISREVAERMGLAAGRGADGSEPWLSFGSLSDGFEPVEYS